jgi:hypothetical protein
VEQLVEIAFQIEEFSFSEKVHLQCR